MEFLWEQVPSQLNHLVAMVEKQSQLHLMIYQSSALLILYFVTWSRSKLYALAFLFMTIFEKTNVAGIIDPLSNYHGFQFFALLTSLQCFLFAYCLSKTNSKSQRFVCVMIITTDLLMALGYLTGGKAALYLYDNYENIVFCLHVMLILSLYKPKPILNAMADKLRDFLRALDSVIFMRSIWYTTSIAKTRLVTL